LSSLLQDSDALHAPHPPHRQRQQLLGGSSGDELEELAPLDDLLEVGSDGGASWEDMDGALQLLEESEGEGEGQGGPLTAAAASLPAPGLQRQWSSTRGGSSSGPVLLGLSLPPLEQQPPPEAADELLLLELPGCGLVEGPAQDPIADSLVALDRQVIATVALLRQRSCSTLSAPAADAVSSKCVTSTATSNSSGQHGSGSGAASGDLPSEEELLTAPPLDAAARRWGDSLLPPAPPPMVAAPPRAPPGVWPRPKRAREGKPGYWTSLLAEEDHQEEGGPTQRPCTLPRPGGPPAAAAAAAAGAVPAAPVRRVVAPA
jgi:hypothetical protein